MNVIEVSFLSISESNGIKIISKTVSVFISSPLVHTLSIYIAETSFFWHSNHISNNHGALNSLYCTRDGSTENKP